MASSVSDAFGLFGDGGDSDDSDDGVIAAPKLPLKPTATSMIERATVALSPLEQQSQHFEPDTVAAAAASLRTHGLVILPGLFDGAVLEGLGDAAVQDLKDAEALAHARSEKQMTKQSSKNSPNQIRDEEDDHWRFHELASRQAGRFEVRHGPNLRAALASAKTGAAAPSKVPLVDDLSNSSSTSSTGANDSSNTTAAAAAAASGNSVQGLSPTSSSSSSSSSASLDLQAHSGVLAVLHEACAAPGMALDPSLPGDRIVARDVGAFVSRPGAADQPLHADNDHLFWHTTLPPHVVTMFLPGLKAASSHDSSESSSGKGNGSSAARTEEEREHDLVGWTTFLPGTHRIEAAERALHKASTGDALDMIHPRLKAGDALLYDARTLHYGMANQSTHTERPLLYVSFMRGWFRDEQNFGTESLYNPLP